MTYKNLKLSVWSKKEGEVRIYIDTAFVDARSGMSYANGCWIRKDDNGMARFAFKAATGGFAEDRALSLKEVRSYIIGTRDELEDSFSVGIVFDVLMARIEQCKTKSGKFSYTKYEKLFG